MFKIRKNEEHKLSQYFTTVESRIKGILYRNRLIHSSEDLLHVIAWIGKRAKSVR